MEEDPLSADERRLFNELEETIFEELDVCFSIGRFDHPDGTEVTSALIADVVWRVFELRLRPGRSLGADHDDGARSS